MKKILLLLLAVVTTFCVGAQTTLINPTGDGGFSNAADFVGNGWTVINSTNNLWHVGTTPSWFTGNGAFISNDGGTSNAYTNSVVSASHFYRDITVPAGESKILLNFNWRVQGETNPWDALLVYYCPITVTPLVDQPNATQSSTATWTGGSPTLIGSQLWLQSASTQTFNAYLPASLAGTTFRLVFTWKNDGSGGTNPPAAVDNISLTSSIPSPLNGSYSINNTLPTSVPMVHNGAGNFANFTDAINYINIDGLTGPVTFNVTAGQTFAENTPALTATGTVANTIVFQKNGGGANPKITPSGTAGTADFGLNITGGDYITFDGIDIEALNNTVEFGYYIINASSTNGATNNTIKNTKITLVNTISGTVGLRMNTFTTPTSAAGANSSNVFKNLTISNAYRSIVISGNATFNDQDNQVTADPSYSTGTNTVGYNDLGNITTSPTSGLRGIDIAGQNNLTVSKCETRNITSTITTGTSDVVGIIANTPASTNVTFTNNLVHDLTGSSTSTQVVYGIWLNGACVTGTTNITANKIYKITGASTGTGSTRGILHNNSSTTGVVNITNNMIHQLESPKGTGTPGVRGIELNTANIVNLYYNTVFLDAAYSGTASNSFQTACLYMSSSAATVLDMKNNIFVNNSTTTPAGSATRAVAFYKTTSTIGTQITTTSNANLWYAGVASAKNLIYYPASGAGAQTLLTFKGNGTDGINNGGGNRENISVSENPPFLSVAGVYDLHLNTAIATRAESGGIPVSTTTDFDGVSRNASFPDMGADEFTGIANDVVGPLINYTNISNTASTANRTFTGLATITDFSGVNTTLGTRPRLYFKRSTDANTYNDNTSGTDGWKYVEASNASSPFDFTIDYALLNLGTGVVGGNIVQYFVVAQDLATTPNVNINAGSFAAAPTSVALTSAAFPIGGNINSYNIFAPYTWNGATSDYQVATNWTPTRTTPTIADQLIFDGTVTPTTSVTNIPAQTINALSFINNVSATLNGAAATNVLTVSAATGESAITVQSGSSAIIGTTTALLLAHGANTGQLTSIAGTLDLQGVSTYNASNSISTVTGTVINTSTATTPFPSHSATNLVFTTGTYQHNRNGTGAPTSATYQAASNFNVTGITTTALTPPAVVGNFTWNCPSQTGTALTLLSTLTTVNGSCTITSTGTGSMQFGTAPTTTVTGLFKMDGGNLIAAGGTLTFNGGMTLNAGTISNTDITRINTKGAITQLAASTITATTGGITFGFIDNVSQTLNLLAGTNTGVIGYTVNNTAGVILPGNLTVNTGAALTLTAGFLNLNGNTLNINGTTSVTSGSIRGSAASNISIGGTGAMGTINFDQTTDGTTNVLNNFTVNRVTSGTATVGNKLVVLSLFTPTAGTLTLTAPLVLRSTSIANTAQVGIVGGSITGSVQVERFIPSGRRAFRLLAPGVTGSTIRAAWQENATTASFNPNAGYGTHITGTVGTAGTVNVGSGFDETAIGNPSLFTFNNGTQAWVAATGTTGTFADARTAYRLLVRGDRTLTNISTASTANMNAATTLRNTGSLATGAQAFTLAGADAQYSLLANPYWAQVSWTSLLTGGTNLNSNFFIWDPTIAGSNGRGGYVSASSGNIQPGQAFFVLNAGGAGTLTAQEAHKNVAGVMTNTFRTTRVYDGKLIAKLYLESNFATDQMADIATTEFSKDFNAKVDKDDAPKFANPDENMSFKVQGANLSINATVLPSTTDTLWLNMGNMLSKNYVLSIEGKDFANSAMQAWLVDGYTKTKAMVNLNGIITMPYVIDNNAASSSANRFYIEFKKGLPVVPTVSTFSVKLSPNPAKDMVTINFSNVEAANTTITFVNAEGKTVKTIQAGNVQTGVQRVNVKDLAKGIYYVNLNNGRDRKAEKLVIQ